MDLRTLKQKKGALQALMLSAAGNSGASTQLCVFRLRLKSSIL